MPPVVYVENVADHVGGEVKIRGWLHSKTDKGRLQFLQIRDGTGMLQCVVFQKEVSEELFLIARRLTQESALVVTGTVRSDERAPGIPGGVELGISDLNVVHVADEYPISLKEHGAEFLLDRRHLWVRSSRQWALLRVRATVMRAIRKWLDDSGFVEISNPIITPAAALASPASRFGLAPVARVFGLPITIVGIESNSSAISKSSVSPGFMF